MEGHTTDGQTDRNTDIQRQTIIPCYYHVGGYKNTEYLQHTAFPFIFYILP